MSPEQRSRNHAVMVWQELTVDPECGNQHWNAIPVHWLGTRSPDGMVQGCTPSGEGETEQQALDACRKEMLDFFNANCEPSDEIGWGPPRGGEVW